MKNVLLKIVDNKQISDDVYLMKLEGDLKEIKNPGEFVEVKLDKYYLRRPISVHRFDDNHLELLYKILGYGTKDMSQLEKGTFLEVLVGLGNGFEINDTKQPLLIAGGIGIAPMYALIEKFNNIGIKPTLLYGVSKEKDLVLLDEFSKISNVIICTDDGSKGYKGNVVAYLKEYNLEFDYYYACGPQVMLKYLKEYNENGYVSLEARMGCGFGACMGCSIMTTNGPKRVCKEGPVFKAGEVIF